MNENLLDHLQEQGYEPQDGTQTSDWYDLTVSGTGTVRVVVTPDDGTDVYALDEFMACEWQVGLSDGTPAAVILATIEAAEGQLAARRGGPVTPAQAAHR